VAAVNRALVARVLRLVVGVTIVAALADQFGFGRDLPTFRAVNFFSYFTVLSNIVAAAVLIAAAVRPTLLGEGRFQLVRGAATLYMAITGIVYNVLLAPASADVSTNLEWVNVVVHMIGPSFVVVDYALDPPRRRPTVVEAATWLVFPAVWLVYTMVRGPIADWYPYPFLDPDLHGAGEIVVTCLAIFVAFAAIAAVLRWWAGRAPGTARHPEAVGP